MTVGAIHVRLGGCASGVIAPTELPKLGFTCNA